jgi:translation initiation factor IF-3
LMFRGREMEHIDLGMNLVRKAIKDLEGVGKPDDEPKRNGRFIMVNLSPLPQNQRVLRFNSLEEAEIEEPDDEQSEDFQGEGEDEDEGEGESESGSESGSE